MTREEARKKYAEDIAKAETAKAEEARLAEEKAAAEKAALEAKETANTRLLEEIRDLLKQDVYKRQAFIRAQAVLKLGKYSAFKGFYKMDYKNGRAVVTPYYPAPR